MSGDRRPRCACERSDEALPEPGRRRAGGRGVSFDVRRGTIVGLVGESGSGKTTAGRCVLRLIEPTAGAVVFDGVDLRSALGPRHARLSPAHADRLPGSVFEPQPAPARRRTSSARPSTRTASSAARHGGTGSASCSARVGLAPRACAALPARILRRPAPAHRHRPRARRRAGLHRRRRAGLGPRRLGAGAGPQPDPGPAADAYGLTMLFIAHDLSVVEYLCDDVVVMYLGRVMETRPEPDGLRDARAIPTRRRCSPPRRCPDPKAKRDRIVLKGDIPSPLNPPSGCVFRTRCPYAVEDCAEIVPPLDAGRRRPPRRLHPARRSRGPGTRAAVLNRLSAYR